jgi:(R,R)-butanediol dehydrogenase/meso-butanediol dehydrogenase/diacetyl reductase
VAYHAAQISGISEWERKTVLILGGGPVGIATIYVLRFLGCKAIIVSEPTATRAAQNKKVANHVFNPLITDVAKECRDLTDGVGVDVVFDCAGIQAGLDAGMDALRHRGTYMNVAAWETPV